MTDFELVFSQNNEEAKKLDAPRMGSRDEFGISGKAMPLLTHQSLARATRKPRSLNL
jgi:hypothetical protein